MQTKQPLKLVVLISGQGSNLQAIIDAITNKQLDATISAVISDKSEAYGLMRAKEASIATRILTKEQYPNRQEYDLALTKIIEEYQADLVILAGFMRILSPEFVKHFVGRILNIHPSLLPNYPGLNTHERVLAAADKQHGVTVHFVTEELDAGPVIAQATLQILPNETTESLKERIHHLEHQLYPLVIQWISKGKLLFTPRGILLDNQLLPANGRQIIVQ